MWMHNGGIGGWRHLKRKLAASVGEQWFMGVQGSTDSEWAFAVFLDSLEALGVDPSTDPGETGIGHVVMRKALLRTIERINEFTEEVKRDHPEEEVVSLLNFAVTDGHDVICCRYVSSKTDEAASLFFSSGTSWIAPKDGDQKGDYRMERRDKGANIVLVASEPLTFERGMLLDDLLLRLLLTFTDNWVTVPTNSTVTIHKQTVLIHPILDSFYDHTPSLGRSSKLALEQGQTSVNKDQILTAMRSGSEASQLTPPTVHTQSSLAIR